MTYHFKTLPRGGHTHSCSLEFDPLTLFTHCGEGFFCFHYIYFVRKWIENTYGTDVTFIEGFDSCIIGMEETTMRVCYSIPKCIDKIMSFKGFETEESASEFFYTKIFSAHHQSLNIAPVFLNHSDSETMAFWLN